MLVVDERDEIVAGKESIRRVAIDDINRTRCERLVFHRGSKRSHSARSQSVDPRQADKSIASPNEIGGEPGSQMRAFTREVAQRAKMVAVCSRPRHCDRIGILKAERREPAHVVKIGKATGYVREHCSRIGDERIG